MEGKKIEYISHFNSVRRGRVIKEMGVTFLGRTFFRRYLIQIKTSFGDEVAIVWQKQVLKVID